MDPLRIGRYTVHVNATLSPTRILVILSPVEHPLAQPSEVSFLVAGDDVARWRALDKTVITLRAEVDV